MTKCSKNHFMTVWASFPSLTQTRVTWEEGPSVGEWPPPDWYVDVSTGPFPD